MKKWSQKINLNGVLAEMDAKYDLTNVEEDCPDEVKTAIAAELSKAVALSHFARTIRESKSIAGVNRVLSRVYDTADANNVWCGSSFM